MATGRPTKYTQKLANDICSQLVEGNSLRKVCDGKGMPTVRTIYNWFAIHDDFLQQYARAKVESGDSDADKIEDIAEKVLTEHYDPAAARVAIDAFKWTAGKKKPKKYGDYRQVEHSGAVKLSDMTDDQLKQKLIDIQNNDG